MIRRLLLIAFLLVGAYLTWTRRSASSSANNAVTATASESSTPKRSDDNANAPQTAPPSASSNIGFHSRAQLAEHFQKHGAEFAASSTADYLRMAQALRDAPVGGDVLEIVRPSDHVVSRYDKTSGAFLAFDSDGTIRTFFKPNDGEAYFRRQAKRSPAP
jgi:pyocin large subunit-like protein